MENALSGIAGIDQLRANVNAGGTASITVRFLLERDLDDAANTVREKVAGAMRNVPPEVLPPVIQKQDPDADPIMSLVVSRRRDASLRALTEIADKQVKRALESVDGVGDVTMSGDRPREIHIVVDIEKLNAHGLSIDQVRDAIQKENVEIPGGTLEQGKWEVGLRTLGRIDATDQFNDIIIATVNGVAGAGGRHRLRRGLGPEGRDLAVHRGRQPRRSSSTSGARPARTPSRSPKRSRHRLAVDPPGAARRA